jgi:hypothetical protein
VREQRDGTITLRVTVGGTKIARVEFAADGIVFAHDVRAPFVTIWRHESPATFTATAYSAGGRSLTLLERPK